MGIHRADETMRIICCGNRERGDDAAGVLVADRLRELGIEAMVHSGEPLALMDAWTGAEDVIIVDAVVTGAEVGTVHRWNGPQPLAAVAAPASTHGLGLAEAIRLGRQLRRLPSQLWIYGVEGNHFAIGAKMAAEVRTAVEKVVQEIVWRVRAKSPALP